MDMKPTLQFLNSSQYEHSAFRRFPIVEFNYRPLGLDEFKTRCAERPRSSVEKISQDYFNGEARRNFVTESLLFAIIAAATVPAILDCGRALFEFMSAIGSV
jgi:hypothetical protein